MAFNVNYWSAKWNTTFKANPILDMIVDTDFAGGKEIGDRVTITQIGNPTIRDYVKGTDLVTEAVTQSDKVVLFDQQKYFDVNVEDIDEVQSKPSIASEIMKNGANETLITEYKYILAKQVASATTASKTLDVTVAITKDNVMDELLIPASAAMDDERVPREDRFMVVTSAVYSAMLGADIINSTDGIKGEFKGSTFGFNIISVPVGDLPTDSLVFGYKKATAFGTSLSKLEGVPSSTQFGTDIRGLSVYGGDVIKDGGVYAVNYTVA